MTAEASVPPSQRQIETLDAAVQTALELYASDVNIPKVVVCRLSDYRRLVTISGDHENPLVQRRESLIGETN